MASRQHVLYTGVEHRGRDNRGHNLSGIRTSDINPHHRFSYAETPIQMQEPLFGQISSPTDSHIDESPVFQAEQQQLPFRAHNESRDAYPSEKDDISRANSPFNLPKPHEVHPAHFAPIIDRSTTEPHMKTPQYQLQTLLPIHNELNHARSEHEQNKLPHPMAPIRGPSTDQKQDLATVPARKAAPAYNPHSLAGPNVALENHRPGQVSHPNFTVDPEWKHGMCEADTLCCVGLFCPCMVYGKTQYRLSQKAQRREATDVLGYENWNGSCGTMAIACGFQWIFASIQQTRIRKMYHINGSIGNDCLKSLCCCCCVLMQNEREVRGREELIRRHAGPSSGAYVSPSTMTYAPPPR